MFFSRITMKAVEAGGKKGLQVSVFIVISAILAGVASALGSPELREALVEHPQVIATIPVLMLVINVLLSIIEKFWKVTREEN